MDRKTVLHEFHYKSDHTGICIASWGVRKRVKCVWRRVCEGNDDGAPTPSEDDDGSSGSSSDEDDGSSSLERATTTATEVSLSLDPDDDEDDEDNMSATQRSTDPDEDDNIDADWWDYSSDESDDSSDEDYNPQNNNTHNTTTSSANSSSPPNNTKRARRTHPCDATSATFGTITIHKGGVYEHYYKRYNNNDNDGNEEEDEEDRWLIKILEFTGKNFPIRKAKCQIIFHMHCAIRECFPNAVIAAAANNNNGDDAVQIDRTIVMETTVKGKEFLMSLVKSSEEEDFDVLSRLVEFDLKRDRSTKLIAQFSRRRRNNTPSSALSATGSQYPQHAENAEETNHKPKELVLFAGIGGCSIGDEEAGFDCKWLVDKDHLAAASLRQCHPHATIYDEDAGAFLDKCTAQRPGYPQRGDVDHIQVSSPCNGFSRRNIYGGRHDHKNNILCHELVRATEIFLPKTGMFENVTGMLDGSNVHHIIQMLQGLIRLNYQVRIAVLNSIDYGVPQKRKRVILTLARADIPMPRMPSPTTHGGEDSFTTIRDAIHDMNGIECEMERHRSGLVQLPNGNFTFNHVARVARKDSKTLDLDEPVATITTQNSFRHPLTRTNRTLSIREYARLFGLPDSVQLFGSYTEIRKHIGNSVPVPLARAISIPIRRVHDNECSSSSCGTEAEE
jgi:DNA (cytosine-5)-methyltransferase 1